MEDKQSEKISKGKSGRKNWLFGAVGGLAVIVAIVIGLVGRGNEPEVQTWKITTPYINLVLPLNLERVITSDESTYGSVYTRGFYMSYNGMEQPLWRVDFGDPNAGDWVGVLKTDKGDIPVTMTGFAISTEELAALSEEESQLYGECMQGYTVMLDGIMSDSRFSAERPLAVGEDISMKLTYWTVTLPDTMQVSENTTGGNYEAVFSAEVVGEYVPLYRVYIGESQATTFLGYFEIDGVKQPVSVEAFELEERANWSEDDYAAAYRMMDTINDVINAIMQSKQFSTEAE